MTDSPIRNKRITNHYGLPGLFVNVHREEPKPRDKEIRCTSLIKPPQLYLLELEHWDELTIDASDLAHVMCGNAVHEYLETAARTLDDPVLVEKALGAAIGGWWVRGTADRLDLSTIVDIKTATIWRIVYKDYLEWEYQLNVYAHLARAEGFHVEQLKVWAYLRDWKASSRQEGIQAPVVEVDIPVWEPKVADQWIRERLKVLEAGGRPCTDQERWAQGGKYAVTKKGRKRAMKLTQSREAAEAWMAENGDSSCYIEERQQRFRRCEEYCSVSKWCEQWQEQSNK